VTKRLLLRADLQVRGKSLIAHTLEVSATQLQVACPTHIEMREEVRVALSFPGLVERLEMTCCVVALHEPDGHGWPASITCAILDTSEDVRRRLEVLTDEVARAGRDYRCLLVEDNRFTRELFGYAVQKYGNGRHRPITISLAEDADQAWRMLEDDAFDMAIVDHYLPSHSGAELIARIRETPRLRSMSLVAISVGGTEVRTATLAAGADLYLDKPVVLRDLFDTIDRLAVEVAQ
jgi:CheY-like chemotaxis protein